MAGSGLQSFLNRLFEEERRTLGDLLIDDLNEPCESNDNSKKEKHHQQRRDWVDKQRVFRTKVERQSKGERKLKNK